LGQLFRTEKSIFTDIVELVKLTNSPSVAKAAVFKYLDKLPKACPTPGCMHDLNTTPFLCKNYRNPWQLFGIVNGSMRSATWLGNALSTLDICSTLERCEDEEKQQCKKCKNNRPAHREAFDGIFCHGCGFFIDFEHQQIGYSKEWTISESLKVPSALLDKKECAVCSASRVLLKFADYFFCSHKCFEEWTSGTLNVQH